MSFKVDFVLGSDVVKTVVFPVKQGVRELRTSSGKKFGRIVLMQGGVRLELEEFAAKIIADAQFH